MLQDCADYARCPTLDSTALGADLQVKRVLNTDHGIRLNEGFLADAEAAIARSRVKRLSALGNWSPARSVQAARLEAPDVATGPCFSQPRPLQRPEGSCV